VSEINRIASEFLAKYLSKNPSVELHRVVCPCKHEIVEDSRESATEFVHKLQQRARGLVDSRIEVSEPTTVNILRVVRKRHPIQPAFLSGFKKRDGRAVWTFDNRLALSLSRDKAESLLAILKGYGFECFVLPAPELRHGTL
jgi:hypothetical protein